MFDELTRADAQVFNSIRKLLLERSFNEEFDLPTEIMVMGALNPDDEGVSELTKHTRDVVDIIPARASWAKTESYLLSSERPKGLEEALGFDCNMSTVHAIKNILTHFQSKTDDWRGNEVSKEERMFNLKDGGDVIYLSPREITDIVSTINANILNILTVVGITSKVNTVVDNSDDNISDDDFIMKMKREKAQNNNVSKGIFDLQTRYSEEDYDAFIDAIIVEFRNVWASKLSFTCKKQDINPANFLSTTTGFITKNNLVRDMYDSIKTKKVVGVKTMGELFNAYYEDPLELLQSSHFDNYLTANLASPQKFVQEITEFMADKLTEIHTSDNSGDIDVVNDANENVKLAKLSFKLMTLFLKYMQYIDVILTLIDKRTSSISNTKDAERSGQYLSNLYISLKAICDDFLKTQNMPMIITKEKKNFQAGLFANAEKHSSHVREILAKYGLSRQK